MPQSERWTAYAEWRGWHGSPDLVAQIARRAAREVDGAADCSIEVHVGRDVEHYADPYEFRDRVTRDALRRFAWLRIHVSGKGGKIRVGLLPLNASLGHPGVVLTAVAPTRSEAEELRDAVAASISRRTGRGKPVLGGSDDYLFLPGSDHPSRAAAGKPEEPVPAAPPQVRFLERAFSFSVLVAVAAVLAEAVSGDQSTNADWATPAIGGAALVGATAWTVWSWVRPVVEISTASRLQRITALVWKGVLATVASALIGKGVELVLF